MKKVLIGHRGTGKTELLKRHSTYFSQIPHFDLDAEIEKKSEMNISEYFKKFGEKKFRETEQSIFLELYKQHAEFVISLGAGYNVSGLPQDVEKVYVRRVTDRDGRIFLNRPRLDNSLSALVEYQQRYSVRDQNFLELADQVYDLPEGLETANETEKKILTEKFSVHDAYYTLSLQELARTENLMSFYKNIELRTDLLSKEIIKNLLSRYPEHNWLVSIRDSVPFDLRLTKNIDVDIKFYVHGCPIVSSHENHISEAITQLNQIHEKVHLKLCPVVLTFEDLIKGFKWQQEDPTNRSFLPRSNNGKWLWFRQLAKYFQKMNFIRNLTSLADQPSLYEWLSLPKEKPTRWGAVLGTPIHFSRSPEIQKNFFEKRNSFFTRVDISVAETEKYFSFLIDLGLCYSAVTSPLKETAFLISQEFSESANKYKSANTLFIRQNNILAENTDSAGFKELVRNIKKNEAVAIWGGGGTLEMMKEVLPQAHLYSSRTGQLRETGKVDQKVYDYLIWAAPRMAEAILPDDGLEFKTLIDLNYTANSPGLEFATLRNIRYISGIEMFRLQALKQQEFWSLNERK